MKILKKILMGFGILLLVLVLVSFFLPSKVHVERSKEFAAKPEEVFPYFNNYHNWNKWNPWFELDPNMKLTYSGPEEGTGAYYKWESEKREAGSGSMLITVSKPNELVINELDFKGQGKAMSRATFEPTASGGTKLTWSLDSDMGMNPIGKYVGVFFMDKMIGESYEKGFSNLETLVEK